MADAITSTGATAAAASTGKTPSKRRELRFLPDAAHDAAQEPEPARPARHQPVHAAARAVRLGRAAAEIERHALGPLDDGQGSTTSNAASFIGMQVTADGATTR